MISRSVLLLSIFSMYWLVVLGIKTITDTELDNNISKNVPTVVLLCDSGDGSSFFPVLDAVASKPQLPTDIQFIIVLQSSKCKQYNLLAPQIVYYRQKMPIFLEADLSEDTLYQFIQQHEQVYTKVLTDDSFEHDTQAASGSTTGDWLVLFYEPARCEGLLPHLETAAARLQGRTNVATLDIAANPKSKKRFGLSSCQTLIFFRQGKMYNLGSAAADANKLTETAEGSYENLQSQPVLPEASPIDDIIAKVNDLIQENPRESLLLAGVVGTLTLVLLFMACCRSKGKKTKVE